MTDFEVHLSRDGGTRLVGHARSNRARGKEATHFEYAEGWLKDGASFPLEPGLPLTRGGFHPPVGQANHASLGDSAPDTWGRLPDATRRA
jgi:serine/threonine-protein kinase HipA